MIQDFFKQCIRSKQRNSLSFIVNFVGMTLALMAITVILQYTVHHLTHDSALTDHTQDVVRIETNNTSALTTRSLYENADLLPELQEVCLLSKYNEQVKTTPTSESAEAVSLEVVAVSASENFFEFFPYPMVEGDSKSAFSSQTSALITQELALKIFGADVDPIGQKIEVSINSVTITGVLENMPKNTSYKFDIIYRYENNKNLNGLHQNAKKYNYDWSSGGYEIFAKLNPNVKLEDFQTKLTELMTKKVTEQNRVYDKTPLVRPFSECYFAELEYSFSSQTNLYSIKVLVMLGILILVIAIINYVNIYTARSTNLIAGMGIKKIFGAQKRGLIGYILMDSIVVMLLCSAVAYLFVVESQEEIYDLLAYELPFDLSLQNILILFVATPIAIGLLAGVYPAIAFTRTKPLDALARRTSSSTFINIRHILIIIQFTISIVLIGSTLYINRQINFIHTADMGVERENIYAVEYTFRNESKIFEEKLLQNPNIEACALTQTMPFDVQGSIEISYGADDSHKVRIDDIMCDMKALDLLGIKIIEGDIDAIRAIKGNGNSMLINETFAKQYRAAYKDSTITFPFKDIVGVIEDFPVTDITQPIKPLVINILEDMEKFDMNFIQLIKLRTDQDRDSTVSYIKKCFKEINPRLVYDQYFIDDKYKEMYSEVVLLEKRLIIFSLLAIFIAALGLFALISYTVEKRRHEIAVRKVFGATTWQIIFMLMFDLLRWFALSFVIAVPLIYYGMSSWSSQYIYRIDFPVWVILTAGAVASLIAIATILLQAYMAARINPAKAIKIL
ncbi:MAG: FtsX-like permease family protein [Rikenellaceae bacterium]